MSKLAVPIHHLSQAGFEAWQTCMLLSSIRYTGSSSVNAAANCCIDANTIIYSHE